MTERKSPFVGKFESYDPVEPLWPYGAVAYMFPIPAKKMSDGKPAIGIRKAEITGVHRMPDGDWRVTADVYSDGRREVFDVDEDGESAECIPWNDDLEETYAPKPPPVEPEERKGWLREMWEAWCEGWAEGVQRPEPPKPPATKSAVDVFNEVMAEPVTTDRDDRRSASTDAASERLRKAREDTDRRHRRAEELHQKVCELRAQADELERKERALRGQVKPQPTEAESLTQEETAERENARKRTSAAIATGFKTRGPSAPTQDEAYEAEGTETNEHRA